MTLPSSARVRVINGLFALYKRWLGPALHAVGPMQGSCPYQPTCSEYAALACAQHGFMRGGVLAWWRVLRCNPFSRGGWDPVPLSSPGSKAQVP